MAIGPPPALEVNVRRPRVRIPAGTVREINQEVADLRSAHIGSSEPITIQIGSRRLMLSATALGVLREILQVLATGDELLVLPSEEEMTTQEVAQALGVSRPYVVSLIDSGILPAHKVGSHRRVKAADLQVYKEALEQYSASMRDLVATSAAVGGYDIGFSAAPTSTRGVARTASRRQAPPDQARKRQSAKRSLARSGR